MAKGKSSSGTRKHGRNQTKCERYARAKKREKSHVAKIRKHLAVHTNDKQAGEALRAWEGRI